MLVGSGLLVAGIVAGGTIVQASTGAPNVAPRAATTHTASFSTTPSFAWDLSNCLSGQPEWLEDEFGETLQDAYGNPVQAVDGEGNPLWLRCDYYGVKDDTSAAPMKSGTFTVRTTLSTLPAGWGLCDTESDAYQGWLWTLAGGQIGGGVPDSAIYVYSNSSAVWLLLEGEGSWSPGSNVVARTFRVATPATTSTREVPVLAGMSVPLCGPDPSTVSGQGWRNFRIAEYRLPAISRWR